MTVKRMQQIHGFLYDYLDDSFDIELESSLLRLADKVNKEIAEMVLDGRAPNDLFNLSIEIINIYLNVLIMSCFNSTREVASLTRTMIEGGIILSNLLKDQNGKFLEDLEARRIKSIREIDNVHAQYDFTTPGQLDYMRYVRIPEQTGHRFRSKLDTCSIPN